jgi:hypothetical protein
MKKSILALFISMLALQVSAQNLNVIVVLDLSKRIQVENQTERDLAIIEHLLDSFEARQRDEFRFVKSYDSFQILIAPQARGGSTNLITPDMSIVMNDGSPLSMSAPVFRDAKKMLLEDVSKVYEIANELANTEGTSGSDLWSIFKSDISQIQTDNFEHVIVITDGYFDFDDDILEAKPKGTYIDHKDLRDIRNSRTWLNTIAEERFSLIPIPMGQIDKVTVLELSPYNQEQVYNESDIQKYIWEDWLKKSQVVEVSLQSKTTFLNNLPAIK